jgi:ribonuclease HI
MWTLFFDGSVCDADCSVGIFIISPRGARYEFSIHLESRCTNNQIEYEALCKGLELLLDAGAKAMEVFIDSKVAINQFIEDYNCASDALFPYLLSNQDLMG